MPKKKIPTTYSLPSQLIHGKSKDKHWDYSHHVVPPMSSSSSYRMESAARGARGFAEYGAEAENPIYVYERLSEPSRDMLEDALAVAESGEIAVTFSTGMAAIAAGIAACAVSGHHIVAHRVLYGSTHSLFNTWLPKYMMSSTMVDLNNDMQLMSAIKDNTRVVYFETPSNPNLELVDMALVKRVVRMTNLTRPSAERIHIVVDNTFASPFCQRPIEHGADLVIQSLTKNICGFGTDMGGAVIGSREYLPALLSYRKDFGGALSPKAAWPILVYGLSTMALRVKKQEKTAFDVALFLSQHPKVERAVYPGLEDFPQSELAKRQMTNYDGEFAPGSLVYFVLKGSLKAGRRKAEKLIDILAKDSYAITLAVSLGQIRTLIEHPSSMTHSMIPLDRQVDEGVDPGGVRISIGLEESKDIIKDLEHALSKI